MYGPENFAHLYALPKNGLADVFFKLNVIYMH